MTAAARQHRPTPRRSTPPSRAHDEESGVSACPLRGILAGDSHHMLTDKCNVELFSWHLEVMSVTGLQRFLSRDMGRDSRYQNESG